MSVVSPWHMQHHCCYHRHQPTNSFLRFVTNAHLNTFKPTCLGCPTLDTLPYLNPHVCRVLWYMKHRSCYHFRKLTKVPCYRFRHARRL